MRKIITLLAILLLCYHTYANQDDDNEYDEIIKFSKNFYQNEYKKINFEKTIVDVSSQETWIDKSLVEDSYRWKPNSVMACKEDIQCTKNLSLIMLQEQDVQSLKKFMHDEIEKDSRYADWSTKNSPFDIIHDLNMLSLVLFGDQAKITFYKYDKENSNYFNPYMVWQKNTEWESEIEKYFSLVPLIKWSEADENKWQTWSEMAPENAWTVNSSLPSAWSLEMDNNAITWLNPSQILNNLNWTNVPVAVSKPKAWICQDPLKINLDWNSQWWLNFPPFGRNANANQWSNLVSDWNNNNWSTWQSWDSWWWTSWPNWDWNNSNDNWQSPNEDTIRDRVPRSEFSEWWFAFIKQKKKQNCKNSLFDGLVCLDENDLWNCDWNHCVKVRPMDDKSEIDPKDDNSIIWLVNMIVEFYKKNLDWKPLFPGRVSNGIFSNWNKAFYKKTNPNFYVCYQAVINFQDHLKLTEAYLRTLREEKGKWIDDMTLYDKRNQLFDEMDMWTLNNWIFKDKWLADTIKEMYNINFNNQLTIKSKRDFMKEVFSRIEELRLIFESCTEETIRQFPFHQWENLNTCNELWN